MGRGGGGEGGKKHCPLIIKNRFKRKRTKFNEVAYTPPEFATHGDGIDTMLISVYILISYCSFGIKLCLAKTSVLKSSRVRARACTLGYLTV